MPLKNDSKRYYWIKIKTTFLSSKSVDFLMRQKEGANYVVLYQSLCLLSANTGGILADKIGEYTIPYTVEKIHGETKNWFSIDTIRVGLEMFKKLGLISLLENNIIKMADF
ncbi:MAG: phage replisome organizer N-terminal domain-containing protein, partial [Caldisericia bacterium]|nr:phage replisome organizer N-terminal domain-containing protein [Caldisericia bacterium]